ncbi:MAG: hypothetical protein ACTHNM_11930 [Dyella sp.]|uniref:hypothetical protein n=1 Tax=Dyella sp. TaxID=1869338 RepID=UPI003F811D5A
MHTFSAIVSSRSSKKPDGPPGEKEILELNPARRERILQVTKWPNLFSGSLNLDVPDDCVHRLWLCTPVLWEDGADVQYPEKYAHIPRLRVGYLYFAGNLRNGQKTVPVLFRRAANPLPKRIEAFASQSLRDALSLSDKIAVTCEVEVTAV